MHGTHSPPSSNLFSFFIHLRTYVMIILFIEVIVRDLRTHSHTHQAHESAWMWSRSRTQTWFNAAGGTHVHNEGSVCVREESGPSFGNGANLTTCILYNAREKRRAYGTTTGNNLIRSILVQIGCSIWLILEINLTFHFRARVARSFPSATLNMALSAS